jgi:hypothetical protein
MSKQRFCGLNQPVDHIPALQKWGYNGLCTLLSGVRPRTLGLALAHSLGGVQIDEHVSERVVTGDRGVVAQFRMLDAELDGLAVDALGRGALFVDILVRLTIAVDLAADACAAAGAKSRDTTVLGRVLVVEGQMAWSHHARGNDEVWSGVLSQHDAVGAAHRCSGSGSEGLLWAGGLVDRMVKAGQP